MAQETIETRVENLERRVTALEQLPARIDRLELQILQFRAEVRDEFSALRKEVRAGDEETCRVLRGEIREMHTMLATTFAELTEESRRETRVLFEELVSRISLIQEARPPRTE